MSNLTALKTERYWELLEREMDRQRLPQRQAEMTLFIRIIKANRHRGFSHRHIARRLHVVWGLGERTYYRRLAKARQTICIP